MVSHMADHYLKTLEHLDVAAESRDDLREEYRKPVPDPQRLRHLNAVNGRSMKLAEVHALLAIAQQLQEISSALDAEAPIPYVMSERVLP